MPRTQRIKIYTFSELSYHAKNNAVYKYSRWNNVKKLSDDQIRERLNKPIYQFLQNGEMYNGLTD